MDNDNDNDFTFCKVEKSLESGNDDGNSNQSQDSGFIWKNKLPPQKEETVGSLSFNVIDASSGGGSGSALSKQVAPSADAGTGTGASVKKNVQEQKVKARKKVPFEKGYSQVDWLKLTRTHPDLAGLKGQSNKRLITMSEVKQNQTEGSMWTVLKGRVYNISPYMKFHPGGVDMLMKAVGKDSTSLFNKYHAWVNDEFLMEKCLVGTFDESSRSRQ